MDREDLDRQLEEQGKHAAPQKKKMTLGTKKIAALALALLIIGGAGGCVVKDLPFMKQGSGQEKNYQIPEGKEKKLPDLPAVRNNAVVQAVREVGPAVVGITTQVYDRDIFNRRIEVGHNLGSGVIFDKKGYIVTNNHVVSGNSNVNVSLSNGKTVAGKVVGTDPSTDLAVVKIEADGELPVAALGDSDSLQAGETVIAIGNPLGLEFQGTVTVGVISALNRTLDTIDQRFKLIQTDAAINPGNSGGALVTTDGKVVGVNSAKIMKEGIEGIGFAIPINSAKGIIEQLIATGKVIRAYLGVYAADKDIAARYGYRWDGQEGVLVVRIARNSPLSLTDVSVGDYITGLDGHAISSISDMRGAIDAHKPGDTISLTYTHNGNSETIQVMLAEAKESRP